MQDDKVSNKVVRVTRGTQSFRHASIVLRRTDIFWNDKTDTFKRPRERNFWLVQL